MKNKLFLMIAFVSALFMSFTASAETVLSGKSETSFGDYKLTEGKMVVIDDVVYRTWNLCYANCDDAFTIYVVPAANRSLSFIIRNSKVELKYTSMQGTFGASLLDASETQLKRKEVAKNLNLQALENQKILTNEVKTEQQYLGLIACFLPLAVS